MKSRERFRIANVESIVRQECGWQDCGEPTVLVQMTMYFVDSLMYEFWVKKNENPQSIDFCPRNWTFQLPSEYIEDEQYIRLWAKEICKTVFS